MWNPDAISPPCGDVYARETQASDELKAWGLVALAAALVALAIWAGL